MNINGFWQKSDQRKFGQLGCIVNVLARHPEFSSRPISAVRRWTENAIAHGYVEIFFHGGFPAGYVAWAYLTEEVIGRVLFSDYVPHWTEWSEGDYVWIMDVCMLTESGSLELLDFYSRKFFEDRQVFWCVENSGGGKVCRFDILNRRTSSISKRGFMKKIAFN
ncbi:toxin-activating lysine-acyltransferase [Burkholderia cepacia]|uniref:toxin-activating lysine-acyltransferase n=1 Tax=Burkholderia cepacia TaxID=292 RepID=UPI002FE26454